MKKYELTQEQINQLAEKKYAKELLQEFLPEAFENKLEVGKVYKYPSLGGGKFMFKFNEFGINNYGFNIIGEWSDNLGVWKNKVNLYEEATKEEWLEALKEEAIKRGFKNVGELSLKLVSGAMFKKGSFVTTNNNFRYISVENMLYLDGVEIFYNGKWAEIIKEEKPTQEEIDRVINYLKNK